MGTRQFQGESPTKAGYFYQYLGFRYHRFLQDARNVHGHCLFSPSFQVSPNQAAGAVLTNSIVLTSLCYLWRHSRSTLCWCVRKKGRSSLYSRMAMWWTWTLNSVNLCWAYFLFEYILDFKRDSLSGCLITAIWKHGSSLVRNIEASSSLSSLMLMWKLVFWRHSRAFSSVQWNWSNVVRAQTSYLSQESSAFRFLKYLEAR